MSDETRKPCPLGKCNGSGYVGVEPIEYCCSGYMCGCMGKPINFDVCECMTTQPERVIAPTPGAPE